MNTLEQQNPGIQLDLDMRRFCLVSEARTPIMAERQLARKYGITHAAVRRVLDQLVADGLVQREHGRGTFVADRRESDTQTLMIVDTWASLDHPYFAGRLKGIIASAAEYGYSIEVSSEKRLESEAFLKQVARPHVQGVLLPWISGSLLAELQARHPKLAVVTVNPRANGLPVCRLTVDYENLGYMAAQYLIQRGCRRPLGVCTSPQAQAGFLARCEQSAAVTGRVILIDSPRSDRAAIWQQADASEADGIAFDDEYATAQYLDGRAPLGIPAISQASRGAETDFPGMPLLVVDSQLMGRTIVETFDNIIARDLYRTATILLPPIFQEDTP